VKTDLTANIYRQSVPFSLRMWTCKR